MLSELISLTGSILTIQFCLFKLGTRRSFLGRSRVATKIRYSQFSCNKWYYVPCVLAVKNQCCGIEMLHLGCPDCYFFARTWREHQKATDECYLGHR